MAEYCEKCYRELGLGNPESRLVMSNDSEKCEGCKEEKPIVLMEIDND